MALASPLTSVPMLWHTGPHVCLKKLRDDSVIKNMYYSYGGLKFGTQHPHWAAHNHRELLLQGHPMPLASKDTCTQSAYNILTLRYIHADDTDKRFFKRS